MKMALSRISGSQWNNDLDTNT
ncbi:hypothetical protein SMJ63A_10248 [Stenotrophomonas geniculata]